MSFDHLDLFAVGCFTYAALMAGVAWGFHYLRRRR